MHDTVKDYGEHRLIRELAALLPQHGADVLVPIGDDCCCVLPPASPWTVPVTSVDMLAEGTHFLGHTRVSWYDMGRKALASNISDIAAMGGKPQYAVVGVAVSGDTEVAPLLDLYRGMADEAIEFGVRIVGGDTIRLAYANGVVLSITIHGHGREDRQLPLRSRATVGQNLYVTGRLGGSKLGLAQLLSPSVYDTPNEESAAWIARHLRPVARVEAGLFLVETCDDLAMIDISDSLYNEASLIAAASGVCLELELTSVPLFQGVIDPLVALFSGEEYELLIATSFDADELMGLWEDHFGSSLLLTKIGRVVEGSASVRVLNCGGEVVLTDGTFTHFKNDDREGMK